MNKHNEWQSGQYFSFPTFWTVRSECTCSEHTSHDSNKRPNMRKYIRFFFRFEFLDQKISTHSVLCEMFAILKNLLEIWKAYVYVILRNSSTNLSASLAVNSYSTRLCYFQRVIPHGNRTALFLCLRLLLTKSKLTFEKKQNKNCELIKTHVIAANFQRCIFPTTTDLTTTPTTAKCYPFELTKCSKRFVKFVETDFGYFMYWKIDN